MKKMLSVFLVMSLMTGLSACGSKTADAGKVEPAKTEAKARSGEEEKEIKEKKESREKKESGDNMVVVYSAYSLKFLDPLAKEFEGETGVKISLIAAGIGELLKRIESEANNPLGDILFTDTVSTVAPQAYPFEGYVSSNEEFVISEEHENVEKSIARATLMPSVLMVSTNLIGDLEVNGCEDLLSPESKGKIAVTSSAQTTSGWKHLANMLYAMGGGGTDETWDFVEKFHENLDGKLLSSPSAVYRGVTDGEYTVGLACETGDADYVMAGVPVKLVYMEEGVIFRGTNICIVKDAPHMESAQKFVGFITGREAQTAMVVDLNSRRIRSDLPDSPILRPYSEVNVIEGDGSITTDNKADWTEHFTDIYTNVQ